MKKLIIGLVFLSSALSFAQTPPVVTPPVIEESPKVETPKTETPKTDSAPKEPSTMEKIKDKTIEKATEAYKFSAEKAKEVKSALDEVKKNRASTNWTITGNYTLYEMWVLSKKGFTAGYAPTASTIWEFEYMTGSIGYSAFNVDIGEIGEKRFSLIRRAFGQRNTFNFLTGVYYNKFNIHLGDTLLRALGASERMHTELMELDTAGVTLGIGNRWQTKSGFVWGFDWLVVNWPLSVSKEYVPYLNSNAAENDKKTVSDAVGILKKVPALGAIKIQLGVSF